LIDGRGFGDDAGALNVNSEIQPTISGIRDQVKLVQETESELQKGYWNLRGIVMNSFTDDA